MAEYARVHAIKEQEPGFIQGILVTLLPAKRNIHEERFSSFKQWEELILAQKLYRAPYSEKPVGPDIRRRE